MSSNLNPNVNPSEVPRSEVVQSTWFDRIFRDAQGNIVIGQPPNLPLVVAVIATGLTIFLSGGALQTAFDLIAFGAWFTWAWLELFKGVNYFRRGLGLVVLVGLIGLRLNGGGV